MGSHHHPSLAGGDTLPNCRLLGRGLPAEQHAIKNNEHPSIITKSSIQRFREQLMMLGFSYDWDREVNTTDPEYYRWTQWLFLKFYEAGMDMGWSSNAIESFRIFQGKVLDEYDRLVDEFGLSVVNAVGSITEQQRTFRKLISQHLAIEETHEQLDEQLV